MTNGGPLKNKNDGVGDGIYRQATRSSPWRVC